MPDMLHTFHIPVMGTGFTLDTPFKVAQYGVSSVVSLVDDKLIEQVRSYYCQLFGERYEPITNDNPDPRANRITAYLNLMDRVVKKQFQEVKNSDFHSNSEATKYFELLPDSSPVRKDFTKMKSLPQGEEKERLQVKLREKMIPGSIDVNIMTKLDKTSYKNNVKLPPEFSDALAALRGFANSTLNSSIVFSAGINRRLFSYLATFDDFYPDPSGNLKKKITIKVSDFRSAFSQSRALAQKGLWVSEFRVESGLNCGGHVFPTKGHMLGPVLEEFKRKRNELNDTLQSMYIKALKSKNITLHNNPETIKLTVQGGVGTSQEHQFLTDYYKADSVGWGTPFLLVPEVVATDDSLVEQLEKTTNDDLYVSKVSPMGVMINNMRTSPSEIDKAQRIKEGKQGFVCFKGHLTLNSEFSDQPLCVASAKYQNQKIKEVKARNQAPETESRQIEEITEKTCLCHQLGGSILLKYNIVKNTPATAVCPGPNLAYFSKRTTFSQMVDHIYGRVNLKNDTPRPSMFITELILYINNFIDDFTKSLPSMTESKATYFSDYVAAMRDGMSYYYNLITDHPSLEGMLDDLNKCQKRFETFISKQGQ
ncbi:hypothetical protein QA601_14865 [Chitinispirillales bacterium ANBcel5]|uniref:hypothetical protein n=1 Tax=Cellulosispirillum alkaliphilum TaxID=3039283 RepID=UPI002A52DBA2|nr:hypothetical protein [Chitinispirillales bacterium ANBcel5]